MGTLMKVGKTVGIVAESPSLPEVLVKVDVSIAILALTDYAAKKMRKKNRGEK